ncbi:response regulator [Acuticoccus sp. M5D2P5]|uniref:response regulator n=1 Tax=Acuticoccus kalidii TaxID=2910977 RepID=UPI001F3E7375|nr:response regulator [Acuticoccus kalidii]MCF3934132.1 response regulator [Acuticoccus kalidii]
MTGALRILIVEDNPMIAMDLAELLTTLGHNICAISRTEGEAVSAATLAKPDLLIVDQHLAEGCGVSAIRRLLMRGAAPHFYVTGDPGDVYTMQPNAIVVPKPYDRQDLIDAIVKVNVRHRWNIIEHVIQMEQ